MIVLARGVGEMAYSHGIDLPFVREVIYLSHLI